MSKLLSPIHCLECGGKMCGNVCTLCDWIYEVFKPKKKKMKPFVLSRKEINSLRRRESWLEHVRSAEGR